MGVVWGEVTLVVYIGGEWGYMAEFKGGMIGSMGT